MVPAQLILALMCQAAAANAASGKPASALASVVTVLKRAASVTPKNLSLDEREPVLTLTCTVGYSSFGAVFWTLYDRDLRDIGHVEESSALMDDGRTIAKVSVLRIGGWQATERIVDQRSSQVLPTESGAYPFKCNTFADFKVASDTALVQSQLTDACTPSDGKCEPRGARCVQGHCACVDERHPLRLRSVHTVCWPKVRLGGRCYFQEQCGATAHSECVVNLGWCACREGFARGSADSCVSKPEGGLWARCAKHADCRRVNARCVYSHCECGTLIATNTGETACDRYAAALSCIYRAECLNATAVPERMPAAGVTSGHLEPVAALQQQQEAPEAPSFGRPHKHIRDSPIADD
ncbi:hypothetical protein HPB50_007236 [Hyalomma asiaticum]|uniref:Uncharacterized protein n=1 Tax=Hyalomma asiaticum TaxID=266040 RepID=A0ACB7RK28_HYAAI|nr:hypothetical protein HPB50_007236 [Hyalomma asiaticum]